MADSEQLPSSSEAEPGGPTRWTCQTCGAVAAGAYCGACGERRFSSRDLGVLALLSQVFESITNVDGRAFRTFRALFLQPGELTLAFLEGRRMQYVAPFQVFLIANVAFFFLQSLLGAQVLSNSFESHVEKQVYSGRALAVATKRLESVGITREAYEPIFDSAVDVNAKALVGLFVPPCALLAWLVSLGRRQPGSAHWVFALHFVAFWLLLFTALGPFVALSIGGVLKLARISEKWFDPIVSWLLMASSAAWVYRAFGRVYGGRFARRVIAAGSIAFLIPVVRIYRFAVFLVTLYTTT